MSLHADALIAALPGWVFVASLDGQVVAASPALRELLGSMAAGERLHERLFPEDLAAFNKS